MSERGEYSPARFWRLKLYKMKPYKPIGSDEFHFYPTNIHTQVATNENNIKDNEASQHGDIFNANEVKETTSS